MEKGTHLAALGTRPLLHGHLTPARYHSQVVP